MCSKFNAEMFQIKPSAYEVGEAPALGEEEFVAPGVVREMPRELVHLMVWGGGIRVKGVGFRVNGVGFRVRV